MKELKAIKDNNITYIYLKNCIDYCIDCHYIWKERNEMGKIKFI